MSKFEKRILILFLAAVVFMLVSTIIAQVVKNSQSNQDFQKAMFNCTMLQNPDVPPDPYVVCMNQYNRFPTEFIETFKD